MPVTSFLMACIARATAKHLGNFFTFGLAGDILVDAWDAYQRRTDESARKKEVEALAAASHADAREAALRAVADLPGLSGENRARLIEALSHAPAVIRRSLRGPSDSSGRTVPPGRRFRSKDDLRALVPLAPTRFRPGDRPLKGVDWELVELLGVGGFGEVWLARNHHVPTMTPVVLKFCLDPEARKQLLAHEASIIGRVQAHGNLPGIVPLLRSYLSADPPCLEFEYVGGGDLTALIRERPNGMPPDEATSFIRRLATTIGQAHRLRPPVVHRDLKPGNVLFHQSPEGKLSPQIADFGIGGLAVLQATHKTRRKSQFADRTMSMDGSYTPLYASPQQMAGEHADPRDDVYSLGVVWYQALTGDLNKGAPTGDAWKARLEARGLTTALTAVLAACLEHERMDRPANGDDLADRIDRALLSAISSDDIPTPKEQPRMPRLSTPRMRYEGSEQQIDKHRPERPSDDRRFREEGTPPRDRCSRQKSVRAGLYLLVAFSLIVSGVTAISSRLVGTSPGKDATPDRMTVAPKPAVEEADAKVAALAKEAEAKFKAGDWIEASAILDGANKIPDATSKAPIDRVREMVDKARGDRYVQQAVDDAKKGDLEAAKEKIRKAIAIGSRDASLAANKLNRQISDATDSDHVRIILMNVSDEEFEQLKGKGTMPPALESGYEGLDRRTAELARGVSIQVAEARENRRLARVEAERKLREEENAARVAAEQKAAAERKAITNSIGMRLVRIPKGKFLMGSPEQERERSPDEGPEHEVRITADFYIGVYEVTQGEYKAVTGAYPSSFSARGGSRNHVEGIDTSRFPVEYVSHENAVKFCASLSAMSGEKEKNRLYRLPTEAEWEYACRGGSNARTPFHFGKLLSSSEANFDGSSPYGGAAKGEFLRRTCEVGSYKPNGYGLYDMHGNVAEWCSDWYGLDYYRKGANTDPSGVAEGTERVVRGGGWFNAGRNCRSATRFGFPPHTRNRGFGFRVVLVPSDD